MSYRIYHGGKRKLLFLRAVHKCHIFSLKKRELKKKQIAKTNPHKNKLYRIVNNIRTTLTSQFY